MSAVSIIAEIKGLDDWELTHPLSATAYKVMRKLQWLAYMERFPERIQVPNGLLMSVVGCSEDSLIRARNQLIQAGLIEYKGQKKMTPLYKINYFSNNSEFAGINQGINAGINQGINAGINQGINHGTYIDKTREDKREDDIFTTGETSSSGDRGNVYPLTGSRPSNQKSGRTYNVGRGMEAFLRQKDVEEMFGGYEKAKRAVEKLASESQAPHELVEEALFRTLKRNMRDPLNDPAAYAKTLLEDWTVRGITNIDEM